MNDRPSKPEPIRVLMERYVLAAIGELPPEIDAGCRQIVQRVWGGDEDWMATLRGILRWNDSIDDAIRRNWDGYCKAAHAQGVPTDGLAQKEEFARGFIDKVMEMTPD